VKFKYHYILLIVLPVNISDVLQLILTTKLEEKPHDNI